MMQLFHELKQQFPAVPDELVNACITDHCHNRSACRDRLQRELQQLPRAQAYPPSLMGQRMNDSAHTHNESCQRPRPSAFPAPLQTEPTQSKPPISPSSNKRFGPKNSPTKHKSPLSKLDEESTKNPNKKNDPEISLSSYNCNSVSSTKTFVAKSKTIFSKEETVNSNNNNKNYTKPKTIFTRIEEETTCKNYQQKPQAILTRLEEETTLPTAKNHPKTFAGIEEASPGPSKVFPNLDEEQIPVNDSNLGAKKRPQPPRPSSLELQPSVNLSVNVNCSVDVLATPPRNRKQTSLQITPEPVWCHQLQSPRSYTSVNLTLRTPTSEPQPPIDICSANSSLTYTTSSFNSKQGLQSRLQITVGPGGGNVTALRSRPSSSYHPETETFNPTPVRAGSMPDLATTMITDTNKTGNSSVTN